MTKKNTSDKPLPHDNDAEMALLGCLLTDSTILPDIRAIITANDFYAPKHQLIYRAIEKVAATGTRADVVTVADMLIQMGELDNAGGRIYLVEIFNDSYSASGAVAYAEVVKDKSKLRVAVEIFGDAYDKARKGLGGADEIVKSASNRLDGLSVSTSRNKPILLVDYVDELLEASAGVLSGFSHLDHNIVCFENGSLYVIGGFPGMGKTAFAYDIARHAFKAGCRPLVISAEMTNKQSAQRIASAETGIPIRLFRDGVLNDRQKDMAGLALAKCAIEFVPSKQITPHQIEAIIRQMRRETPPVGLVVVDYLQLITPDFHQGARHLDVGLMARRFKLMALEYDIPVVVLSQLRRLEQIRPPMLSDLRDSGEIEQHADGVIFVHRTADNPDGADIIIAKMRQGEANVTIQLPFYKPCSTFSPIPEVLQPPMPPQSALNLH